MELEYIRMVGVEVVLRRSRSVVLETVESFALRDSHTTLGLWQLGVIRVGRRGLAVLVIKANYLDEQND